MEYFEFISNLGVNEMENIPNSKFEHGYRMPIESYFDPHHAAAFVTKYWALTIPIGILYVITVFTLQSLMKDKKPYNLSWIEPLWNGLLAIFSFIGLIRISEDMFYTLKDEGIYASVCHSFHADTVSASWYLFFAFSKFMELGDTLLLVLKKKKLTFLHCYHHAIVLVYTSQSGAEQIGAGRWYMWMNFLAHSLMYTYFTVMSLNMRSIKKYACYVTSIQTLQMFIGIIISGSVYFVKRYTKYRCKQTYFNLYFCFTIYLSFAFLFVKFFVNSYYRKKIKTI
uniref:Elongation of very long chain fatty acids protein n=1 Tax=Strongyloides papillosus TaxID=174720 RepID=A0A0N5BTS6_STREA